LNGLKIIRFKNEEVEQDINQVLTTIKNKIEQLKENKMI
jgi:very-short-patch-repair endonuclease